MIFFQALLKFSAIGVILALLLLFIRDGRYLSIFRYVMLLIFALLCLFLTTGHSSIAIPPPWAIPLRMFDMLSFVFVWWFGLALFEDNFRLKPWHWLCSAVFAVLIGVDRTDYYGFHDLWPSLLDPSISVCAIFFMIHLAWVAVSGRHEDLIDSRRKMRIRFSFSLVALIVLTTLMERLATPLGYSPFWSIMVIYLFTLVLGLWAILWLTKLRPDELGFLQAHEREARPDIQASADYQRLIEYVETSKGYRQNNLSIGDLAEAINIPAHQLRQLINQGLGYRNYSSFLNHFRLNDVKLALADPEHARTPILTLALEAGFASLAPFNRAFKEAEGMTPTEYRQKISSY
jgi:AraC-type DNA-binding domain-containing proteins